MIGHLLIVLVSACFGFAGLIYLELTSSPSDLPMIEPISAQPEATPAVAHAEAHPDDEVRITLAAPLFSPSRKRPDTALLTKAGEPELPNLRLTGIVIEPERRIAIFAADGKPLARTEGESLADWRVANVSEREVSLSGPGGTTTLGLKPDPKLSERPPLALATTGRTKAAITPPLNPPSGPLAQAAAAKSLPNALPRGPSPFPIPAPSR